MVAGRFCDTKMPDQENKSMHASSGILGDMKFDVPASIAVALVALPLCLGIAIASGAEPISGIISGIIGGILVGALSGSQTSVSGPAAGLTAVVLSAIASFGGAFEIFLLSVVLAGLLQIGLGFVKAGFIVNYFPTAVIRGLLAAIGLILIFKQIPHAFGIDSDPEGEFSFNQPDNENTFSELLHMVSRISLGAIVISGVCLAIIILWEKSQLKKLMVPSSLVAVAVGVGMNMGYQRFLPGWALSGNHLVELPKFSGFGDIGNLVRFPDWSKLFSEHTEEICWVAIELAVVASLETLLNVEAIDKLDPRKRRTPPDRELVAQGIGNVTAGLIGGLPVTSVVVRSSMNVNSGGISKKATILHGIILLLAVGVVPSVLSMIPLSALAAILLITGYRLASLPLFISYYRRGLTQFLPFAGTVLAILFSDLMWGIAIGLAIGLYFILRSNSRNPFVFTKESHSIGDVTRLKFAQQVTFLNRAPLLTTLANLSDGTEVIFDARGTDYVDQDILALIRTFRDEEAPVRNIHLNLIGFRDSYDIENTSGFISVLTAETQQKLTPARVLNILREGNKRFIEGRRSERDLLRQMSLTSDKQHPMAAVLSCIDSRTTSELIFDLGFGDIFSVRVAGNVVCDDVLGSLEFATKIAGAKLIVVKGHTRCGAVNSAINDVTLGNVTGLLSKIKRAILNECSTPTNDRHAENQEFVRRVTCLNVLESIDQILQGSPVIRQMVEEANIAIVGALYDVQTGRVEFLGDLPAEEKVAPLLAESSRE